MSERETPRTDVLWSALMDACKASGIPPARANKAFGKLSEFRELERENARLRAELVAERNERREFERMFRAEREAHAQRKRLHELDQDAHGEYVSAVEAERNEILQGDVVPSSRYWACNADWLREKERADTIAENAKMLIEKERAVKVGG